MQKKVKFDEVDLFRPLFHFGTKGIIAWMVTYYCESIIVFVLKVEAEARVDVLSILRVTNSTRVHSRHHLLNRPVRECLVTSTESMCALTSALLQEVTGARVGLLSRPVVITLIKLTIVYLLDCGPVRNIFSL